MEPDRIPHFRTALLQWYETHQRRLPWRSNADPYRIWVSEVMLQQTRVDTVIPYYERFLHRFPDVGALAASDLQSVLKLWEGLGYYARARHLHRAAQEIVTRFRGRIPDEPEAIQTLPGVGDYIASAVLSIAFGRVLAVVDGNVKRVLARLYTEASPVNRPESHKIYKGLANRLIAPECPGIFNQAMMEVGALVCKPRLPNCPDCPMQSFCRAFALNSVAVYPNREKKRATPRLHLAAGVVRHNGRLLITQRKPEGLLGGLWEFPSDEIREGESPESACHRLLLESTGLTVRIDRFLTTIHHAYTHFRITMEVFRCTRLGGQVCLNSAVDYRWIRPGDFPDYPFPKANLKFIPLLYNDPVDGN